MRFLYKVALAAALVPAGLFADGLSSTSCPTNTFAYYEANFNPSNRDTGPCANGILNFSGFQFFASGDPSATLLTADDFLITPIGPGVGELGSTGFSISGVSVGPDQTATYVFDWFYEIDAGPRTAGGDLGMDPPFGDATVTQTYCLDSSMSPYEPDSDIVCRNDAGRPVNDELHTLTVTTDIDFRRDSETFDPPGQSYAYVRTIFQLNGGAGGAGFDLITGTASIADPDAAAPEPGTMLLISAGMLAAGLLRKRVTRRSN